MTDGDPIAAFYARHPYPPPVGELGEARSAAAQRFAHHTIWPRRAPDTIRSILIAGCGTSQAARHALRHPSARVVGIDVSETSIEHTLRLAARHRLTNLEVRLLPIEEVGALGELFDHVVCTGVLHHLADPMIGLRALRSVLAPGGAVTLMVYARYGRVGVYLLQDYCRRLGITPTPAELADLVATLAELPEGHPLSRLLRQTRDLLDDDALADALLNPRDRAYSVAELFELLDEAGLRFVCWQQQAPYRPDCGSISETPHARRIAAMPAADQYAAVELFRGTLTRHTSIACSADEPSEPLRLAEPGAAAWIPLRAPTAVIVRERLPPGASAVLLNRAHPCTDLLLFVDRTELELFEQIDGRRPIAELGPGAAAFVERLWRHDLVAIDATPTAAR